MIPKKKALDDASKVKSQDSDFKEKDCSSQADSCESTKSKKKDSDDTKQDDQKLMVKESDTVLTNQKVDELLQERDSDYQPIPESQLFDNLSSEYENS